MSKYAVTIDGQDYELEFDLPHQRGQECQVTVGDETLRVRIPPMDGAPTDGVEWIIVNDRPYEVVFDGNPHVIQSKRGVHTVEVHDRDTSRTRPPSADGRVKAPIPGMIARLLVAAGQSVELGQPLMILEAMKMENEIRAPRTGVVGAVHVQVGRVVSRSELLAEIV
jgi:biotin carboxyl carrier protein